MSRQFTKVVFFDIGDTLGTRDNSGFHVFEGVKALLTGMRNALGLRVGVITNLPLGMTSAEIGEILRSAGLLELLDAKGLITSVDAKVEKPAIAIYRFAAAQMGVQPEQCLYVGEAAAEVEGALQAGMAAIQKPLPPSDH